MDTPLFYTTTHIIHCIESSYSQYFFLSTLASDSCWRIRIASMMADHVGGGSICFSHSFNISLKHLFDS